MRVLGLRMTGALDWVSGEALAIIFARQRLLAPWWNPKWCARCAALDLDQPDIRRGRAAIWLPPPHAEVHSFAEESDHRGRLLAEQALVPADRLKPLQAGEDDRKLLALGVELDGFLPEYHAQLAKDALHRATWEAECLRLGLPRLEHGTVSNEEWRERNDARLCVKTIYSDEEDRDVDGDGVSIAWTRLHDEMYSILDRVMDCQPKTMAGLGVMARAASLDYDSYDSSSTTSEVTELLMMALCKFCGVDPVLRPENEVEAEDGDDDAEEDTD